MFLLLVAQAPLMVLVIDSGRDLAWGLAILHGEAWPAYGPELNATWHLGPVWYYLLAVLLAVAGSTTGVAVLVAALGASKLWFTYRLGEELGGRAMAIACAALIALPGWPSLGQMVLSHTSLVEAAVAATLWLAVRAWRRREPRDLVLAALGASLAIHAHPTAIVLLPLLAFAALRYLRQPAGRRALLSAVLLFVLPFAPALWAEASAGWPQLAATEAYSRESALAQRMLAWPGLLWGMSIGQAEWTRDYLLAGSLAGRLWYGAYLGGLGLAALGVVRALAQARNPARWLLPLAVGSLLAIGLLRDAAPAWMFYPLAVMTAALGAIGLLALVPAAWSNAVAGTLVLLALVVNLALLDQRLAIAGAGLAPRVTLTVADIHRRDPAAPAAFWLPAWGHDAVARRACRSPGLALHGELATAMHFGQGVPASLACERTDLQFGGRSAERHRLGIPNAIATALGVAGERTGWGFTLVSGIEVLAPARATLPQPHTRYLRNDYAALIDRAQPERQQFSVACEAGDLLVVGNLVPWLNVTSVEIVSAGGPSTPVLRSLAADYHRCIDSGVREVAIETLDLDAVMLVRVPAAGPRGAGAVR